MSIVPKKSLGQHWLHDADALTAMADAANLTVDDTVLEIGPGLGTLTQVLVDKAKQLIAVEFDNKLASDLPKRVQSNKLEIVQQDILQFDLSKLPPDYKVIANIPYYLTSNLIRRLSETPKPPLVCALLVQKEVAERAAASPGSMSLLGVSAQFFWDVELGRRVRADLFTRPPKVDSQILILKRRPAPLFGNVEQKRFFRIVKAGFSMRRKTLLNSLSAGLGLEKQQVINWLETANIQPNTRPQALSLDQWHDLYQCRPEITNR